MLPELLALEHEVVAYDNLHFGGSGLLGLFRNPKFSLIEADIRDSVQLQKVVRKADAVLHLAAIVGYPACEREPKLANEVNIDATRSLARMVTKEQFVLFCSTCSTYGATLDGICTEDTPLKPTSLYGKTKAEAEKIVLNECTATSYRFGTAFGLSPRLRLDLMINDFVNKALNDKYIVVYQPHFVRSFIHVHDIARSFLFALENRGTMAGEVYNVGDDRLNRSKKQICELIASKLDYYLHFAEYGKDLDARNYLVSYDKIGSLGYHTTIDLETGIDELISGVKAIKITNPYSNI